jgi:hypothetical protein
MPCFVTIMGGEPEEGVGSGCAEYGANDASGFLRM